MFATVAIVRETNHVVPRVWKICSLPPRPFSHTLSEEDRYYYRVCHVSGFLEGYAMSLAKFVCLPTEG